MASNEITPTLHLAVILSGPSRRRSSESVLVSLQGSASTRRSPGRLVSSVCKRRRSGPLSHYWTRLPVSICLVVMPLLFCSSFLHHVLVLLAWTGPITAGVLGRQHNLGGTRGASRMEQFHVFSLFHVETEPVASFSFPFLTSFTCLDFSPCLSAT